MSDGILRRDEDTGVFKSVIKQQKNIIPIKLNDKEIQLINLAKQILEQPKDSTIIKQLMKIGYKSIISGEKQYILKIIKDNKRKNKRLGIVEYEA